MLSIIGKLVIIGFGIRSNDSHWFRLLPKNYEIDPYKQQKYIPCGSEYCRSESGASAQLISGEDCPSLSSCYIPTGWKEESSF